MENILKDKGRKGRSYSGLLMEIVPFSCDSPILVGSLIKASEPDVKVDPLQDVESADKEKFFDVSFE